MNMFNKLTFQVNAILNSKYQTKHGMTLERLLYYLSKIYELVMRFRIYLYEIGILKSKNLPCFVISIGNIVAGGTGKTPMTIFLANYLQSKGYKVTVVTRGYKGEFEQKGGIVCDDQNNLSTQKEAGDESYMMAQLLQLPILAGKNRYESCISAIKKFSPDIIILDDAFQHLALKRDLDLLLINSENPFGNSYLLPRGFLREPLTAVQRCDAVIYTHSDSNTPSNTTTNTIADIIPASINTFKSNHTPYIKKLDTEKFVLPLSNKKEACENNIQGKIALLFSGIANNSNFRSGCKKMGFKIKQHIEFADHYQYSKQDIDKIKSIFKQGSVDFIVTTLKDYVKISDCFSDKYPVMVLDVKIEFNAENRQKFDFFLKNKLKQKKSGGRSKSFS